MADLFVHFEIPIPTEPLVGAPALTFARWLPIGDSQAINVKRDRIALKLWFDITSTWWASHHREKDLPRMVDVLAHRVFADAVVRDVSDDLLQYMAQRDFTRAPTPEEQPLQQRYDEVAEQLLVLVLQTLNRLLSYVRSRKGQYWLSEYPIDSGQMSSYYVRFKAQARSGRSPWFRFGPSSIYSMTIELVSEERYIRHDEWDEIRTFVCGVARTPLARTLLAGAEALAANGHSRSALTEAVTALEVALYAFARHPNAERAFGPRLARRINASSLQHQVEHMGLTGSIRYLLPVILPESDLPQQVIQGCQEAIAQRQSVVHQGQRDVQTETLRTSLAAIRRMCELLESLTMPTPQENTAGEGYRLTKRQTVSKPSLTVYPSFRQPPASHGTAVPSCGPTATPRQNFPATYSFLRDPCCRPCPHGRPTDRHDSAEGRQQPRHLYEVQHPPEVIRQYRHTALGPHLLQPPHQKVAVIPPPLHRSKRVLSPAPSAASSPLVDSAPAAPSLPTAAHRPSASAAARLYCACTAA